MPKTATQSVDDLSARAMEWHRAGDHARAEAAYREVLLADAEHAQTTHMLGVLAFQAGRADRAAEWIGRAIDLAPAMPDAHANLGLALLALDRPQDAAVACRKAIALKPEFVEAWINLGNALVRMSEFTQAIDACEHAIALRPGVPEAHHNLGLALGAAGRPADAILAFEQAQALRPDHPDTNMHLGGLRFARGDFAAAQACFERVLARDPGSAAALNNVGLIHLRQGDPATATSYFRQALSVQPAFADAHHNLAIALRDLGQLTESLAAARQACACRPDWPEAANNLGIRLHEAGRMAESIEAFGRAIALRPGYAEAHNNVGSALRQLGRYSEAIECYRRAIELQPDSPEPHNNLGNALQQTGQLDEAAATLQAALARRAASSETYVNLGNVRKDQGDLDMSIACYARAADLRGSDPVPESNRLYALHFHPGYDAAAIFREHAQWNQRFAVPLLRCARPHANESSSRRRLRIGYVSPDFRDHCQALFLTPLLARHDRERVEVHCYSDVVVPDSITARLRDSVEVWRNTVGMSDAQLADLVRHDGIDVLVDLTLHMAHHRLLAFARRPAPVQVTWLGYPGTTGMPAIDYRLSDPHLDPPGLDERFYAERTVRLPETFWCYDPLASGPAVRPLPAQRNGFVTFGCLNNFCKVNHGTLRCWARVMRAVPGSRLLLLAPRGSARERTAEQLAVEGIDRARIEFADRCRRSRYLELYQRIDIGLDTFPYNGHTTSLDSAWMGVPVVTMVGHTAVGRAGVGQLSNLGLRELAGGDEEQFVSIATALACDPSRLARIRAELRDRLVASPLMDAPRFAANMELAFAQMWMDWSNRTEESIAHRAA